MRGHFSRHTSPPARKAFLATSHSMHLVSFASNLFYGEHIMQQHRQHRQRKYRPRYIHHSTITVGGRFMVPNPNHHNANHWSCNIPALEAQLLQRLPNGTLVASVHTPAVMPGCWADIEREISQQEKSVISAAPRWNAPSHTSHRPQSAAPRPGDRIVRIGDNLVLLPDAAAARSLLRRGGMDALMEAIANTSDDNYRNELILVATQEMERLQKIADRLADVADRQAQYKQQQQKG